MNGQNHGFWEFITSAFASIESPVSAGPEWGNGLLPKRFHHDTDRGHLHYAI